MVVATSALSDAANDIVGVRCPSSGVDRVELDAWRRHNGALKRTRNSKGIKMFILTTKHLSLMIRIIRIISIS
jgi:hypothetical protein